MADRNPDGGGPTFTSHSRSDGGMMSSSLRILCLHDGNSNAGVLSDQLEALGERLYDRHMIDLVYVNAPLLVNTSRASEGYDLNPLNRNPQRVWWEETERETEKVEDPSSSGITEEPHDGLKPSRKFMGLDASLLLLRQIWNSMPFWGVIAVGKGAAAASFLPLLPLASPPQFMIFIHGDTILEEMELLVDDSLSKACLHLVDTSPNESTERLIGQFGGRVVSGVSQLLSTKAMNAIGKFIVEQKKSLRTTNADAGNILALQNHLFLAEQQVANMVAQRIALDPPRALMAVISPQNVGGWTGGKRRAPNEEGGGAPCPSEFLLRREKRSIDEDGPTREHPNRNQIAGK